MTRTESLSKIIDIQTKAQDGRGSQDRKGKAADSKKREKKWQNQSTVIKKKSKLEINKGKDGRLLSIRGEMK